MNLLYQAARTAVFRVVSQGTVIEVIDKKVDKFSRSQNFVYHLTSNLMKKPSFSTPTTHLLKQHAQVIFADEAKIGEQSIDCAN